MSLLQAICHLGHKPMHRLNIIAIVIWIAASLIGYFASLFLFPEWGNSTRGLVVLFVSVGSGVLIFLSHASKLFLRTSPQSARVENTLPSLVTPVANETPAQEPRVYLREQSPNEVAARIKSLKPIEQELFANQTYVGRWVRWSGEILSIRSSNSFLEGGAFTVAVGDHVLEHTHASLEFLSTERHLVEPLEVGDMTSYEAKITRAFSTEVYLTHVTFMQPEERSVVDVTPEYLMRFFEGRTDLQASIGVADYIGKWMKVAGPLGNVSSSSQVTFADRSPVHMFFRKKKWVDRLSILSRGDNMTVLGQISYVERGNLVLDSCEFID